MENERENQRDTCIRVQGDPTGVVYSEVQGNHNPSITGT